MDFSFLFRSPAFGLNRFSGQMNHGVNPFESFASCDEVEQYKDRALRWQAELDNYRKRASRELEDRLKYADMGILRDLLPVLDNIQRAVEHAEKSPDPAGLRVAKVAEFRTLVGDPANGAVVGSTEKMEPLRKVRGRWVLDDAGRWARLEVAPAAGPARADRPIRASLRPGPAPWFL